MCHSDAFRNHILILTDPFTVLWMKIFCRLPVPLSRYQSLRHEYTPGKYRPNFHSSHSGPHFRWLDTSGKWGWRRTLEFNLQLYQAKMEWKQDGRRINELLFTLLSLYTQTAVSSKLTGVGRKVINKAGNKRLRSTALKGRTLSSCHASTPYWLITSISFVGNSPPTEWVGKMASLGCSFSGILTYWHPV